MPRLRTEAPNWIKGLIKATCGTSAAAAAAGRCMSTFYTRLNTPDTLTVAELRAIRKATGLPKADFVELVGKML